MAMNPVSVTPKPKSGGGIFGKILGGLAGAAIGAATGNPAGIATGLSIGSSLGGAAGEMVKPTKFGGEKGVPLSAMANRPDVQMVMLDEAKKLALNDPRVPTDDASYLAKTFTDAQEALRKRMSNVA